MKSCTHGRTYIQTRTHGPTDHGARARPEKPELASFFIAFSRTTSALDAAVLLCHGRGSIRQLKRAQSAANADERSSLGGSKREFPAQFQRFRFRGNQQLQLPIWLGRAPKNAIRVRPTQTVVRRSSPSCLAHLPAQTCTPHPPTHAAAPTEIRVGWDQHGIFTADARALQSESESEPLSSDELSECTRSS